MNITYWKIRLYLKSRGYKDRPEKGTFCFERKEKDNSACTSAFIPIKEIYSLAVICKDKNFFSQKVTLKLTKITEQKKNEVYRVDFDKKNGWHLQTKKYTKHDNRLKASNYKEAIDLILKSLERLPMNTMLENGIISLEEMTDPENIRKESIF